MARPRPKSYSAKAITDAVKSLRTSLNAGNSGTTNPGAAEIARESCLVLLSNEIKLLNAAYTEFNHRP